MKIIIGKDIASPVKVLLDNGMDITADLMINAVEIKARCGDFTKAILTVYPSEVFIEMEDGGIEFIKHPSWDAFKK